MAVAGVGALCGTGRFQLGNSKPAPPPDWALEPALREASGQRAPALASAPRGTPTFISLISKSLNQIPQALQGLFLL